MGNQHSIVEQLYPGGDSSLLTYILDEDEDILEEVLLLLDEDEDQRGERKEHWDRCRIDWYEHVMKSLHEDSFSRKYRMSYHAYCYLVDLLRPSLTRMSSRCRATEFVFPEIIAAVGIRWLAGESYLSLMDIMNISKTEVYACRDQFIDTILSSDDLSIKLPQTQEEWESVRAEFAAKSRDGIFGGCVGAIDGFFQPTNKPTFQESGGVPLAYYSGHYCAYGLNVQAACDARLRFIFFGVVAPGKTNDNVAYLRARALKEAIDKLPIGLYFLGDAAYTLLETLLIPFTGSQREDPDNDAYNFYLSQLRIRIEMAFGLLVTKWRILRKPLQCSLKNNSRILLACALLHNYVINADGEVPVDSSEDAADSNDYIFRNAPANMAYLPHIPEDFERVAGRSQAQQSILEEIREHGIRRPLHNLVRNGRTTEGDSSPVDGMEFFHPT